MRVPVNSRAGVEIATVDDWEKHASTKGKWAGGYSAKELARLWLGAAGPQAIVDALAPVFEGLVLERAVAEAQVSFDRYAGGVRNHDVLAFGRTSVGPVVIGVEGKVNESLDATMPQKSAAAASRRAKGQNTNLDKRVDALLADIAGGSVRQTPGLSSLRYQLFSAIAGTVAAAEADTVAAAVVVHLIRAPKAKLENSMPREPPWRTSRPRWALIRRRR